MPRRKGSKNRVVNKSMKLSSPTDMAVSKLKTEVITAILGPKLVEKILIDYVKAQSNYPSKIDFQKAEVVTCKQGFMVTLTNPYESVKAESAIKSEPKV